MGNGTNEISEAVILFLGVGSSPTPSRIRDNLTQRFGPTRAALLESQVRALLDEVMAINIDWEKHSLVSGGELALAHMRLQHPELNEEALKALEWEFSWNWR